MSIFGSDTTRVSKKRKLNAKCLAEAKDLGIVRKTGTLNEAYLVYDLNVLYPVRESETENIVVKRNRSLQMDRLVKRQVLNIASDADDVDFIKWRKYMDLARKYRENLDKKYKEHAVLDVKEVITSARNNIMGRQASDMESDANANATE